MALQDFLSEGAEIPAGSAIKSTVNQTVLPSWYTEYAMDLLSGQQALAQRPYTPFQGPRVADFTPTQQQAFQQAQQASSAYQPALAQATNATSNLLGSSSLATAKPYYDTAAAYNPLSAVSADYGAARGAIGAAQGINPAATAGGYYSQALGMNPMGAADPSFNAAQSAIGQAQGVNAGAVAEPAYQQALGMNPLGTAQPYYGGALSYTGQSTNPLGMSAADPYLRGASGNVADVDSYMNPYTNAVVSRIAELGTRNLADSIMPALEGRYISSGQFRGSGQMTDTARAIRDVSNDILGQQSAALQQGYNAAQSAKTSDLNRYAGLASTAGNLGMGQQNILANAGRTLADIGTQSGQFTQGQQQLLSNIGTQRGNFAQGSQANALAAASQLANLGGQRAGIVQNQQQLASNVGTNLGNLEQGRQQTNLNAAGALSQIGSNLGNLTAGQQDFYAGLGSSAGALSGADASRGLSAAQQLAGMGGLAQSLGLTGAGALGQVGSQQQQLNQQNLNVAYEDFLRQQGYPQSQIDAMLGTFKGVATGVPGATQEYGIVPTGQQQLYQPSTASNIAAGLTGAAGLAAALQKIGIF